MSSASLSVETEVKKRYAAGAQAQEEALCCPVEYDPALLEVIPSEVIERDYGCGDPTKYLQPGETVLDLGSGSGKHCFMASQIVGAHGRVLGVDMTDDMLAVARRNAPIVAERIGYSNVRFLKGRIQDLALDLEKLTAELAAAPIDNVERLMEIEQRAKTLRKTQPMIASDSIDVVVSNCVLNLVDSELKNQLFDEIFRVLKRGGRAVISDIVSDEDVPESMQNDPELWTGCISGAYREDAFLEAFEKAGFYGVEILKYDAQPWRTIEGIEFRSVTVQAFKGKQGPCIERNQAVIYKGPFKKVWDDDNHELVRGKRMAVCDKTCNIYRKAPYAPFFDFVDPIENIPLEDGKAFDCSRPQLRHPRESKGLEYNVTTEASESCCGPEGCC